MGHLHARNTKGWQKWAVTLNKIQIDEESPDQFGS